MNNLPFTNVTKILKLTYFLNTWWKVIPGTFRSHWIKYLTFIKIKLNICISSHSPVISDVMIKIPLAVALYTLVTSGWNSLPYNVFLYMFAIVETNQQSWNESLVGLSWIKRKTNKCHTNSKVKYKTWQLTFNQYGEHNCYILLIKKCFFKEFF